VAVKAKVAERGQVTIPKVLRVRLGIQPGTVLEFSEDSGRLVAAKAEKADSIEKVYGCVGRGRKTKQIMNELRGTL
jgi:AbrB family looped-hinge helix DNA binding protein